MNIKDKLIHLLGGFTEKDIDTKLETIAKAKKVTYTLKNRPIQKIVANYNADRQTAAQYRHALQLIIADKLSECLLHSNMIQFSSRPVEIRNKEIEFRGTIYCIEPPSTFEIENEGEAYEMQ